MASAPLLPMETLDLFVQRATAALHSAASSLPAGTLAPVEHSSLASDISGLETTELKVKRRRLTLTVATPLNLIDVPIVDPASSGQQPTEMQLEPAELPSLVTQSAVLSKQEAASPTLVAAQQPDRTVTAQLLDDAMVIPPSNDSAVSHTEGHMSSASALPVPSINLVDHPRLRSRKRPRPIDAQTAMSLSVDTRRDEGTSALTEDFQCSEQVSAVSLFSRREARMNASSPTLHSSSPRSVMGTDKDAAELLGFSFDALRSLQSENETLRVQCHALQERQLDDQHYIASLKTALRSARVENEGVWLMLC